MMRGLRRRLRPLIPWLGAALIGPAPPSLAARAAAPPIAVGERLPELRGRLLSGREMALPDSSLGSPALLMLGFTYDSRRDVEAWAERYRREFGADTAIAFFEVPVIGGAGRLARPFIDRGMRRGTPRELQDHVITVYRGAGDWKRRVGFSDPDVAYLLLVDREGRLVYRARGPFDEERYRELAARVRRTRE